MIDTDLLLYKLDQKLNKLSTFAHQQIQLEDKILALNEAQIRLVKQKMDGTPTASRLGEDAFRKRQEDLQMLIESHEDHPLSLSLSSSQLNKWTASLKDLKPSYMFYQDAYFLASKGACTGKRIWINPAVSRHTDLQIALHSPLYGPSFEYGETFSWISTDEISVFTDGTFTPSTLYLSYLRYPSPIDKEGYTDILGNPSTTLNSELPLHLEDELTDLTVLALSMYTENPSALQSAQYRIQTAE